MGAHCRRAPHRDRRHYEAGRTTPVKVMVIIIAVGIGLFALATYGTNNDPPAPVQPDAADGAAFENDPSSRIGSAAVYARIDTETNCVNLQREFDIAMGNAEAREPGDDQRKVSLAYADAAYSRAREVGCYG